MTKELMTEGLAKLLGVPESTTQPMGWGYEKLRKDFVKEVSDRLSAPRATINELPVEMLLKQVDALTEPD